MSTSDRAWESRSWPAAVTFTLWRPRSNSFWPSWSSSVRIRTDMVLWEHPRRSAAVEKLFSVATARKERTSFVSISIMSSKYDKYGFWSIRASSLRTARRAFNAGPHEEIAAIARRGACFIPISALGATLLWVSRPWNAVVRQVATINPLLSGSEIAFPASVKRAAALRADGTTFSCEPCPVRIGAPLSRLRIVGTHCRGLGPWP